MLDLFTQHIRISGFIAYYFDFIVGIFIAIISPASLS
jgi:hypothetical protein